MFPAAQAPVTDQVCHFGGVHVRVTGQGSLMLSWHTLDHGKSKTLVPISMMPPLGKIPFRLGGFVAQRAALRVETQAMNDYFQINRIIFWCSPLWTGYPG